MDVQKASGPDVGRELAGYRIEASIGRGGMGAVYRAEETGLGRNVALKVIAAELAEDERFRERFLRESRIAASLDHPHIVPILSAGEEDGVLYIAMRYVEGTDLAKLVAGEGALDPGRAVDILEQVAEALDAAHEKGLVHRDVKPSNVLIAKAAGKEHAYLADFGLTKRTASLSGVTAPGDVVGTLDYVAPEQITGNDVDARADLYSLGCVLYECLTGSPPFPRATDVALLWAHVHEEPQRPSELRPELPKAIDSVLLRSLAKDPARRYRTCGELVSACRAALGLVETAPAPRTRLPWIVAAAAALLAVAVVAGVLLSRGSSGISTVAPNSVGVIDSTSSKLVGQVRVGVEPQAIAVGSGSVWVANRAEETISRIDPRNTSAGDQRIGLSDVPSDIAIGGGRVWVALGAPGQVVQINTAQNRAASPIDALGTDGQGNGIPCGPPDASLAVGGGFVWFTCESTNLGRVDPRSDVGRSVGYSWGLLTSSSSVSPKFSDVAFGLGSLWIADSAKNSVVQIDPTTGETLNTVTTGKTPAAIAVGRGTLWVANTDSNTISWFEVPGQGQAIVPEASIEVGDRPVDVAVSPDGSSVWVANAGDATVQRIDPAKGEVVETVKVGNLPQRLAVSSDEVWVTVQAKAENRS